jgi:hypothetical protein
MSEEGPKQDNNSGTISSFDCKVLLDSILEPSNSQMSDRVTHEFTSGKRPLYDMGEAVLDDNDSSDGTIDLNLDEDIDLSDSDIWNVCTINSDEDDRNYVVCHIDDDLMNELYMSVGVLVTGNGLMDPSPELTSNLSISSGIQQIIVIYSYF